MNRQSFVKIMAIIFIAVLLLLIGHSLLHGLEKDDGHCLLCDLLVTGLTFIERFELLLILFFIAIVPQITPIQFKFSSHLKIRLRAPPYYPHA
jgi:hypothetical protein